ILFLFQTDDSIRHDLVTAVQTCALPISARSTWQQDRERIGRTKRHSASWTKKQSSSVILSTAGRGFPLGLEARTQRTSPQSSRVRLWCSSFGERTGRAKTVGLRGRWIDHHSK